MGCLMQIDLDRNTIDGRSIPPVIVELAAVLRGGPLPTEEIIPRLYGINEPADARNAIKQLAFRARSKGVRIVGSFNPLGRGNNRGTYRLG